MSRKKVSTTIYITPEQGERLKLLHDRTKVPIAVYIREGIDMVLKHYEHVLPGQMTLANSEGSSRTLAGSEGAFRTLESPAARPPQLVERASEPALRAARAGEPGPK